MANGVTTGAPAERPDYAKWIAVALAIASAFTAALVFLFTSLEGKASASDVSRALDRVTSLEQRAARIETDLAWIKAGVWATAQRVGAQVQPPPAANP